MDDGFDTVPVRKDDLRRLLNAASRTHQPIGLTLHRVRRLLDDPHALSITIADRPVRQACQNQLPMQR